MGKSVKKWGKMDIETKDYFLVYSVKRIKIYQIREILYKIKEIGKRMEKIWKTF